MGLKTFCGADSEKRHEYEQLLEIKALLEKSDQQDLIYMITNFRLANSEVDCLLLRLHGPVILELKSIEGEIHGDENSEWYVVSKEGIKTPLNCNLFRQMGQQRYDFLDKLMTIGQKYFPHIDEYDLRKVGTWGYFKVGSKYPEGQINLRRVPWFDIVTSGSLLYKLKFANAGYTFTEKDMENIVKELHVKECEIKTPEIMGTRLTDVKLPSSPPQKIEILCPLIEPKQPSIPAPPIFIVKDANQRKILYTGYNGKYSRMISYLESCSAAEITLSYNEILDIIKVDLPPSAYKWTMWWQNQEQPHVTAWMELGWTVSQIRLGESITFVRKEVEPRERSQLVLLNPTIQQKLNKLLIELDFPTLYSGYLWKNDSLRTGFKDIVRIELEMSKAAKTNSISDKQIVQIAEWGGHQNIQQIKCTDNKVLLPIYEDEEYNSWVLDDPAKGIEIIKPQIYYFGPTFTSKVLRFALPSLFGSIDRNIVLTFGIEESPLLKDHLLNLSLDPTQTAISTQKPFWPDEYGRWIYILRYIADELNSKNISCPHPDSFVVNKLRNKGIWVSADVEMALYSFTVKQKRARLYKK